MFENITRAFDNIGTGRNYYFLRTSKGTHFNAFKTGNFIGINWNYITTSDLRDLSEYEIKSKIATFEPNDSGGTGYDISTKEGKQKVTGIYNKIIRFQELRKGDMVVMPSAGSEFLAFGYIDDDEIYNELNDPQCDWNKRRTVHWITVEEIRNLDPIYYKIVYSKHAISRLNDYASHIDKVVSSVFIKEDISHLVLDVRQNGDIKSDSLIELMSSIKELTSILKEELDLNDLNQSTVKLNVQSPGTIEFLYRQSKSLLLAGLILTSPLIVSCSHTRGENAQRGTPTEIADERERNIIIINNTIQNSNLSNAEKDTLSEIAVVNYDAIANTKKSMDALGAKVERLNTIE